MSPHPPEPIKRPSRRRGQELENALLQAALDELSEHGYTGFTIESVAMRANTSRAVLYRRWPGKAELIRAALAHARDQNPIDVPDTGNVRDDLIELLRRINHARAGVGTLALTQLAAYFAETGTGPAQLRESLIPDDHANSFTTVLGRAMTRGEIDPTRLTPRVASLPMDLLRQELMMTLRAVPDETITEIVDEVFLPLVGSARPH